MLAVFSELRVGRSGGNAGNILRRVMRYWGGAFALFVFGGPARYNVTRSSSFGVCDPGRVLQALGVCLWERGFLSHLQILALIALSPHGIARASSWISPTRHPSLADWFMVYWSPLPVVFAPFQLSATRSPRILPATDVRFRYRYPSLQMHRSLDKVHSREKCRSCNSPPDRQDDRRK